MVYAPHWRVTALGRLGAGDERFSYGVNLAAPSSNLGPTQAVWEDAAADVVAFHGRATSLISGIAYLELVKVAPIGADGSYTGDPVVVAVSDVAGGGGATNPLPLPQASVCVSLNTDRRGPSGKGRFYTPMTVAVPQDGSLLMSEASRDGIQASAATLLNNLNNQPGLDVLGLKVVVASTKGYNTPVTGVRVGRVVDTIRSRRRSLAEQYDPVTLVS